MRHAIRIQALAVVLLVLSSPSRSRADGAAPESSRLPRSAPEAQGVASSALLEFLDAADAEIDALHGFVLVRHGNVIAEGWWAPYDAETPHVLYSLSKSFTSTAVGLAVADGKLSLDDRVVDAFPDHVPEDPSPNLRSMRVRDLLRMQTGHASEPDLWRTPPEPGTTNEPWTRKFLAHPVPFKPGTRFLYDSTGTYLLSAMVQKATGQTVLEYLRPRLLDPLGFEEPRWLESPDGVSLGGFGFLARTGEIARFGQLYLQRGRWNGRQILPEWWVDEATALQTSNGSSPTSDWDQGYGYQFWRCRHGAYRGDGAFGQYCIVLPERDAVVAITSGVRDMQAVLDLVWTRLLPALGDVDLPADPVAQRALEARLDGLTLPMPEGRATSPALTRVAGREYRFPDNDRGLESLAIEAGDDGLVLVVREARKESRTPVGLGTWTRSRGGFVNGLDRALGMPEDLLVGASGAWTEDDVLSVRLALCESPYVTSLRLRFADDRVEVDAEHNVAFGPRTLPRLVAESKPVAARPDGTPEEEARGEIRLLVRADDMGVALAINEACIASYERGIARSVEIIVPGAWFLDAVERLREHPGLDVGVHLTLTSEWSRAKWRPLTHAPSLVDADGYFRPMTRQRRDFPSDTGFLDAGPEPAEVEAELRAQIALAIRHLGDRVTHVSAHMGAATATPELRELTARVAAEFGLRTTAGEDVRPARGFGTSRDPAERERALIDLVAGLEPGDWMLVEHPGYDTPELRGFGHPGYEDVAADRAAVTHAFTSPAVVAAIARRRIALVDYTGRSTR